MQSDDAAKRHINEIRRNLFVSNKIQRDRQDRSIGILSNELYSSFGRVLLEILQNADDSNFEKGESCKTNPQVYILLRWDCLAIHINERGMNSGNIESVCDIGNSSKKNSELRFFTGEKGIGYRSVFKVTDNPGIYSGGYSIRFSSKADEEIELRYIVPRWEEPGDFPEVVKTLHHNLSKFGTPWRGDREKQEIKIVQNASGTIHYLPFGRDAKQKFSALLSAVHDTFVHDVLLFLRNIRSIIIDVEPRKESGFCSAFQTSLFPLLRRRLIIGERDSAVKFSREQKTFSDFKKASRGEELSYITGFRIANIQVAQFDDDDLDQSKKRVLRESLVSSDFLVVDWEIPIPQGLEVEEPTLRDRLTRTSTQWSIALPLFHSNLRLGLEGSPRGSNCPCLFSLGSSTSGKQKRLSGKLFCTFPLSNRMRLPFHVNIQDLILTANREDFMQDSYWNSSILDAIFKNQIPEFITGMVNPSFSSSQKLMVINEKLSAFLRELLNQSGISQNEPLARKSNSRSDTRKPHSIPTSELIKLSWLPSKAEHHSSHLPSYICTIELLEKPVLLCIDGSFQPPNKISSSTQIPDFCSRKDPSNLDLCTFCSLHWNFLSRVAAHMGPVLHPALQSGQTCMHAFDTKPVQAVQSLVAQTVGSFGVSRFSVLELLSGFGGLEFLESLLDEELLALYGYLYSHAGFEGLGGLGGVLGLPIIPTRENERVSPAGVGGLRVYVPEDSFDRYWEENDLRDYSEIIERICPVRFFKDDVYEKCPNRLKKWVEEGLGAERMTPSLFFRMVADRVDALLEKGWKNALDKDIQKLLLKVTPLAIEETGAMDNESRFLIKLPVVVQTYSPSFLRALLYNKDPPTSYADEEELRNKNKLARMSLMRASNGGCSRCGGSSLSDEEMIQPVSVALRMSQVSKSLTALISLHSNWERSNKFGSKQRRAKETGLLGMRNSAYQDSERESGDDFKYKGLTIVPPLWPPLVEWVFPRVSDRFHFVELSKDYIMGGDDGGLGFRSFMNKFVNLLEQWYVGCNFDRLPPKTDASALSWMTSRNTHPVSSFSCFYCRHLVYVMRAGATIQIANEYLRRSYSSSFMNEILSSLPWVPVSLLSVERHFKSGSECNKGSELDGSDEEEALLSRPGDLFIGNFHKGLDQVVKKISEAVLSLLPVTLRNAYKIPKTRDNESCSTRFVLTRTEEDIGNESKLITETLEEVGVTTRVSSTSLIRILRDIKEKMAIEKVREGAKGTGRHFSSPLYEPDLNFVIELATFGFGITKEKLLESEWWSNLVREWATFRDGTMAKELPKPSNFEIVSDLYQLIGIQADFDISADLKNMFYSESLLFLPLMKSSIYNWVQVNYSRMVWSDPYEFFQGTIMVLSNFITRQRITQLRPFFLALVSEYPIHQHYAFLWLRECPNLLKDESKEGKIRFESFVNIAISKFLAISQKTTNNLNKVLWWMDFLKSAKVPLKGAFRFCNRNNCCLEDFPISEMKGETFSIPLALSNSPSTFNFYRDVMKLKTVSECYRVTYRVRIAKDADFKFGASKARNKLWLTLEFWGTLILLLKQRSLDTYLSILRVMKELKGSESEQAEGISTQSSSAHSDLDCDFCVSSNDLSDHITEFHKYEPVQLRETALDGSEGLATVLTEWFRVFANACEVEVDDIELDFELKNTRLNLPKRSVANTGVLLRRIPGKKGAFVLFVNRRADRTGQLKDLYNLLMDPLRNLVDLNHMINTDLFELLILSNSQRQLLLSKQTSVPGNINGSGGGRDGFTACGIAEAGLDLLKRVSSEACLEIRGGGANREPRTGRNDLLSELSERTKETRKEGPRSSLDSTIREYMRQNPLYLGGEPAEDKMTLEEISKKVGLWGEQVSFDMILPNAISRKLALQSVDFSLVEDYLPFRLLKEYLEKETADMEYEEDFPESSGIYSGIEEMDINDSSDKRDKKKKYLICKIKSFRESETSSIKLVWLNSPKENFLPCDFVLLREFTGKDSTVPQSSQEVLALIEVKATKLPVWQFNISGNELLFCKKAGGKSKLLLIKDAGSQEPQWTLIDNVGEFFQERCVLVNGLFEADFVGKGHCL
ncbi:sacsin like HSP90 chaperone domain [Cryptosporidium felis]|nr:sacsin like HSP90 chaperone domain [Cryptosporidium felis]